MINKIFLLRRKSLFEHLEMCWCPTWLSFPHNEQNYTIISPHTHTHTISQKRKWYEMSHTSYHTQWRSTTMHFSSRIKGCSVEHTDDIMLVPEIWRDTLVVTHVQHCTGCSNMASDVKKVTTLRLGGKTKWYNLGC